MTSLCWSPVFDEIADIGGGCSLLIAPFIQRDALESLLDRFETEKLQVITSWTAKSLAAGVSDPEVYQTLKQIRVPLYINEDIHLKLFVFDDDVAFHTSANITSKGLGIAEDCNIEIGCKIQLALNDWLQINTLLENSMAVDDAVYQKARAYTDENKNTAPPLPPLNLPAAGGVHPFSRQSLPQCKSPEELWLFYDSGELADSPRSACMHDLWLYGIIEAGMSKEEFLERLGDSFRKHPFTVAIVSYLQEYNELRFGSVNNWITQNCSDRPTPSRWELKPATNRLYNWLARFFVEITWSQPNRSQIMRWTSSKI